MVKSFRDLLVWQRAIQLSVAIYRLTQGFPREEIYGMTSQMRRSAVSVPSNIAEGYGRKSTADYVRFLQIAISSLYEVQTQLEIARNLGCFSRDAYERIYAQSRELERMLSSLIRKVGPQ